MPAVLWGRDHVEYGTVIVAGEGKHAAVALSRGRFPKPYAAVDPNEDVVAAVAGPRATLLAVADGHHGAEAAEVAVGHVLERLGEDPPPGDLSDDALVDLFVAAGDAVRRATRLLPLPNRGSQTTLSIALIADRRVQWAGMGDSAVIVATAQQSRQLQSPDNSFVGSAVPRRTLATRLRRGAETLSAGAWVVLASDGFTNFAAGSSPEAVVVGVLRQHPDPERAARGLVLAAAAGGAGDNVAVAVAAPG